MTPVTRQLLNHWNNPERERNLFFCQREAAETLIWLIEASPAEKQGIHIPKDEPNDPQSTAKGYKAITRYACKMATGSGKTLVMGMVIAWQILNKLANPQDRRFADAVLILCPNLTIKERLQVLLPWKQRNFYEKFDLVPRGLLERLQQGKYLVTNWHLFQPQDDSRSRSVVQRGLENDRAFCNRVLKELGNKQHILVINDEAHHAYRPAPLPEEVREELSSEEIAEREEATVWVNGLDRINATRGINFCADFSATPFYIKGNAPKWEHSVAFQMELRPEVVAYARNDHLDFTIPYEWQGVRHEYRPDYLLRLRSADGKEVKVVLEVKGLETEQDRQKEAAARRWVRAVNHHGEFRHWEYVICKDPLRLKENLKKLAAA